MCSHNDDDNYDIADVAARLLRLSTYHHRIQDEFWSGVSKTLTELVVILDPDREALRLDVLNQLTSLTSLKIGSCKWLDERPRPYVFSVPSLKSLYVRCLSATDLTLACPELHILTLEECRIKGSLSLPASLKDFKIRGASTRHMQEAFPVSSLLGLISLHCSLPETMKPDLLYDILPSMSALRTLELCLNHGWLPVPWAVGQLPPLLPTSLLSVRYFVTSQSGLGPVDLQRLADACQLPELQSMSLQNCAGWDPEMWRSLEQVGKGSNVKVFVGTDCPGHSEPH